jgi:AcrR family transcriptional regulator
MDLSSEILNRAKSLFIRCGIKSTTMDDLAKGLGISKKTLYEKVPNKAALIEKMVHQHIREEKKALALIRSQASNAVEEMVLIAQHVILMLRQVSPNTAYEIRKYYWESWKKLDKLNQEHILGVIRQNLKDGIAQGYYRSELAVDIISKNYVTLSAALIDETIFPAQLFSPEKVFKETIRYHLGGITTPKGWELCERYIKKLDNPIL